MSKKTTSQRIKEVQDAHFVKIAEAARESKQKLIAYRRDILRDPTKELWLSTKTKDVSLRIWITRDGEVRMRLDHYKHSSIPLSVEAVRDLGVTSAAVHTVASEFGFAGAKIADIYNILDTTMELPETEQKLW